MEKVTKSKEARSVYMTITLRASEESAIEKIAEISGMSKSSWVRQQVLLALAKKK